MLLMSFKLNATTCEQSILNRLPIEGTFLSYYSNHQIGLENHEVDHLNSSPDITAKNPFIHVSLVEEKKGEFTIEWDVRSCSSYYEELGRWSRLRPGLAIPA